MEQKAKDIDWESIKNALVTAEVYEDMCGNKVKSVYLGSVFSLTPSGKYYMPWACSNVTEKEAEKDEEWWEELEEEAAKHGLFVHSGEGDPTDVFIGELIEEEENGQACLTPIPPIKAKKE